MRRVAAAVLGAAMLIVVPAATRATAAPAGRPHATVGGFVTASGDAVVVAFADGSLRPNAFGDAFRIQPPDRISGAARLPRGGGFWMTSPAGNVYGFGAARAFGGMGGVPLRGPIIAMLASHRGNGYLLFGRDGGVFAFGDAVFRGSLGARRLSQPIVGVATSPAGNGYWLVGRDGGVFTFGGLPFAGSLPARRVRVRDVVGLASTPTGRGYWMARSDGRVAAFGDAVKFGGVRPSACDPIAAIVANPDAPGYRLVTDSGRTIPRGHAPGGPDPTGVPRVCGHVRARIELPASTVASGGVLTGYLIVDNQTHAPLRLHSGRRCRAAWAVTLGNDAMPNSPLFSAVCTFGSLRFPVGDRQYAFALRGRADAGNEPLPAGDYEAKLYSTSRAFPHVAPVPVRVVGLPPPG
jgi:uncharacterized membrane protein YgdD (TMEM256/DUF423 family)